MTDLTHAVRPSAAPGEGDLTTLVELLFFAYRDFTGEADALLAAYGLGRAHHRVLHFLRRHPGLRVSDLLEILKITKQSLARVLNHLVDKGWVESHRDSGDQRARRLQLTSAGMDLATRLAGTQEARVARALAGVRGGIGAEEADVRRFLYGLISDKDRAEVLRLIAPVPGAIDALTPSPAR